MIKADLIVFYWIFLWYLVYVSGYIHQNPKLALWIAFLCDLFVLLAMVYFRVKWKTIVGFTGFILISKVLLLWSLRNTKITRQDLYATIGLYIMYVGWAFWEDRLNIVSEVYKEMFKSKGETPLMVMLHRI